MLQVNRRRSGHALLALCVAIGSIVVASAPSAAASAPSPARVESFELPSPLIDPASPGSTLSGRRTVPKVNVLLPEGYDDSTAARYPVLWLLHGANGGTNSWLAKNPSLGSVPELLAGLPAVVVMPDGGTFGMYMDWWNGGARGGPAWTSYHLGLFKDTIEQRYRIRPERRWHAIAGISMGGQGALRYAALLPGYFGSVVAMSAALPDMQAPEAQLGLGLIAAAGGAPAGVSYDAVYGPAQGAYAAGNSARALAANYGHSRMLLVAGNGIPCPGDRQTDSFALDVVTEAFIHGQQGRFAREVRKAGGDVTSQPHCGVHTFGVWDRAFAAARRWGFFEPVAERPRSWTYRTVRTTGEAWGLRYRFGVAPSRVVELHREGQRLTVSGTGHLELRGSDGCALDLELPYAGLLPPACRVL
jgi:S-formylglutathione hydrolase FrmB